MTIDKIEKIDTPCEYSDDIIIWFTDDSFIRIPFPVGHYISKDDIRIGDGTGTEWDYKE